MEPVSQRDKVINKLHEEFAFLDDLQVKVRDAQILELINILSEIPACSTST